MFILCCRILDCTMWRYVTILHHLPGVPSDWFDKELNNRKQERIDGTSKQNSNSGKNLRQGIHQQEVEEVKFTVLRRGNKPHGRMKINVNG